MDSPTNWNIMESPEDPSPDTYRNLIRDRWQSVGKGWPVKSMLAHLAVPQGKLN